LFPLIMQVMYCQIGSQSQCWYFLISSLASQRYKNNILIYMILKCPFIYKEINFPYGTFSGTVNPHQKKVSTLSIQVQLSTIVSSTLSIQVRKDVKFQFLFIQRNLADQLRFLGFVNAVQYDQRLPNCYSSTLLMQVE